jgi:Glyoxalase-like domain
MAGVRLDHVAVATDDLDRAEAAWRRLGFTLTRRSSHRGADGPWGTGNHCVMLRDGYFELIGITDPTLYHDHLKTALARYTGLHLVALGSDDSDRAFDDMRRRGVPAREPYAIARQVPFGVGQKEGRFRITEIDGAWFPEADLFFCQHETPDVLWQPDLVDHANGVTGLSGVAIAIADPGETARRLALVTGVEAEPIDNGHRFVLDRGAIDVVSARGIGELFPSIRPPVLPWVAAVSFAVADLDKLRAVARASDIALNDGDDGGVWVAPDATQGAVVTFRPADGGGQPAFIA